MARRPCDAIAEVHLATSCHFPWVLRGAIAHPVTIERIALLGRVRRRIGDGRDVALTICVGLQTVPSWLPGRTN